MKTKILNLSKIIAFTSIAIFSNKNSFGQCTTPTDQDNFNNSINWSFSSGSFPNISNGLLNIPSNSNGGEFRAYRPIKNSSGIVTTLSNNSWTADFSFRINSGNSASYTLLGITAGQQEPMGRYQSFTDDGVTTQVFTNNNQDGIFASLIAYGSNQLPTSTFNSTNQNWDATHPTSNTNPPNLGWRIYGHAKNNNGSFFVPNENVNAIAASNTTSPYQNHSRGISLPSLNIDYYLRLERVSSNICKISVFSDAAMTNHIQGSPQCFTVDTDIQNLNTIQNFSHISGSYYRTVSGQFDNLKIFNNCNPQNLVPAITCSSTFCIGQSITVTGSNTGNINAAASYWEIIESNSSGIAVTGATPIYQWVTGNPGTYQFPNNLPCGKYYRMKLALSNMNECLPWAETTKVIFVACNPNGLTSISNICLGSSATLCIDEAYQLPSTTYTVSWGKKGNNINCINVTPTATGQTIYTAIITNTVTGCTGQKQFIINTYKNDPSFSYNVNTSNSSYNTIGAIGNDLTAINSPGFGEQWFVEEINAVSGASISTTSPASPPCWWVFPSSYNYFGGYSNLTPATGAVNVNCGLTPFNNPVPSIGQFSKTKTYRITRGTWNNFCPWAQASSTISPQMLRSSGNTIIGTSSTDNTIDYSNSRSQFNMTDNNIVIGGKLTVFPNPSNGQLNINFENAIDSKYNVEIFDIYGKLIYKQEVLNATGNEFNTEINLSNLNLSNGLYLINVNSDNQNTSQRIVIEK